MAEAFDVRTVRDRAPGDDYFRRQAQEPSTGRGLIAKPTNNLDGPEARATLRQLLEWYYFEKEKQATNRLEMAMDADFYDNIQWDPDDASTLRSRGQMPLVFNEVAPMVDWVIGTERRTRVDWKVLPRTEDDVQLADVKTKVLKYLSDVNRVQFNRSRAFADAMKAGVGWIDDGIRDDPTQEIIYNRVEDWRNVLWDSASYEPDLSDARYIFRWRWVDEDIAVAMFPDRADKLRRAVEDHQHHSMSDWEEDTWYTAEELLSGVKNGTLRAAGSGMMIDSKRRRVRLIECQYRKPVTAKIVADGSMRGAIIDMRDRAMLERLGQMGSSIIDKVVMRVHAAVFTEADMIAMGPSIYRHNRFSLTPVWCYRRGRDRLPYGIIRRVRDIQQDLNKRASKALFMLNTNQIIADEGAVEDWDLLRDEADRPDGMIVKKKGAELKIQRDTDAATGQVQMMTLDAQAIQKSAGVTDENLGRKTNAVSGKAIEARQMQGGVVTTEPFDNLRFATQVSGEKQLSLSEQFLSEEKVVRLTEGVKGALQWIRINQPELQADGSVRFLNDITASMADFIVSEADYAGTMRQFMFGALNQLAARLDPQIAMRVMTIAMEFSDLPNKDEVAEQFRKITGERDPNKEMTPEEIDQQQKQMAMQAEAMEMQRQQARTALEEQAAKVRKLNAEAAKMEAEVATMGSDPAAQQAMQGALTEARKAADQALEAMAEKLRKLQADLANRTLQIAADKDAKIEAARIQADATIRVAELQRGSDEAIQRVMDQIESVRTAMEARFVKSEQASREAELQRREQEASKTEKAAKAAPAPAAPAPAPAPAAPVTIHVQVDAKGGEVKKSIEVVRDKAGNITGAQVKEGKAE